MRKKLQPLAIIVSNNNRQDILCATRKAMQLQVFPNEELTIHDWPFHCFKQCIYLSQCEVLRATPTFRCVKIDCRAVGRAVDGDATPGPQTPVCVRRHDPLVAGVHDDVEDHGDDGRDDLTHQTPGHG